MHGNERSDSYAPKLGKVIEHKILNVVRQEEEEWRVKSKQLWLNGGDSNTEYFLKQTKARQSYNFIKELKDKNGNKITGQEEIKDHAFNNFLELYTDSEEIKMEAQAYLLSGIPTLINNLENRELSKPFLEFEIKKMQSGLFRQTKCLDQTDSP